MLICLLLLLLLLLLFINHICYFFINLLRTVFLR